MGEGPDPAEAKRRYAELAATYDRRLDQRFVTRMRIAAVRRLKLHPGDRVLDVGRGTGANLPYLGHGRVPAYQAPWFDGT
jgi:ubiquinone/menaquinone biosynthesis C-methylase UbiE